MGRHNADSASAKSVNDLQYASGCGATRTDRARFAARENSCQDDVLVGNGLFGFERVHAVERNVLDVASVPIEFEFIPHVRIECMYTLYVRQAGSVPASRPTA